MGRGVKPFLWFFCDFVRLSMVRPFGSPKGALDLVVANAPVHAAQKHGELRADSLVSSLGARRRPHTIRPRHFHPPEPPSRVPMHSSHFPCRLI
jgi:hypothetical protein